MSGNVSADARRIPISVVQDMMIFDTLPAEVRQALREARKSYSASNAAAWLRAGKRPAEVTAAIRAADAQ